MVSPTQGQVAHALLTRPPLGIAAPFDLNVLCTPPAFILSQDQTLEQIVYQPSPVNIKCVELVALFTFRVCIPFYRDVFQRMTRFSHLLLSCLYLNLLLFNCQ